MKKGLVWISVSISFDALTVGLVTGRTSSHEKIEPLIPQKFLSETSRERKPTGKTQLHLENGC